MPSIHLSDYKIGEVLGVGTVGTILAALDLKTGEKVAIKKLHKGVSQDPLIRARFRREMLVLQRLDHPNIVRYLGGGEDDGDLFYAMELVDGGTVKNLLQVHRILKWPVVAEIAKQVCSALQCAHNHGVVHRDLKPGNLFLTKEGDVKLGDFGIARDLKGTDISAAGMTVGTHAYMAPEQITGDVSVSGKADLYSLGCCLFEMIVGRPPFQGDNYRQLLEQHLRSEPPRVRDFVASCPSELDEIVRNLLAKNPEDRPFNARQVQGVMLKLQESLRGNDRSETQSDAAATDAAATGAAATDVAVDDAAQPGREMLRKYMQLQAATPPPAEVGWRPLAVMAVAILAVIIAASLFGR